LTSAPVLDGELISAGVAVEHPNLARPVAFVGGVAVAPLLRMLDVPGDPAQLVRRWTQHAPPPLCWRILQWLCERGILEPAI
jgi:hypothetical protein